MEYIEVFKKVPFLPDLKSKTKQGIIEKLLKAKNSEEAAAILGNGQ